VRVRFPLPAPASPTLHDGIRLGRTRISLTHELRSNDGVAKIVNIAELAIIVNEPQAAPVDPPAPSLSPLG